jgi:acyl-CoA synthetase (AMP-forming)/AMP-acid ligase II
VIIVNADLSYAGPVERPATRPSVAEAYVVGVPDDRTGEAVHAFVVPARGHVPELRELRALLTANLGGGVCADPADPHRRSTAHTGRQARQEAARR